MSILGSGRGRFWNLSGAEFCRRVAPRLRYGDAMQNPSLTQDSHAYKARVLKDVRFSDLVSR